MHRWKELNMKEMRLFWDNWKLVKVEEWKKPTWT